MIILTLGQWSWLLGDMLGSICLCSSGSSRSFFNIFHLKTKNMRNNMNSKLANLWQDVLSNNCEWFVSPVWSQTLLLASHPHGAQQELPGEHFITDDSLVWESGILAGDEVDERVIRGSNDNQRLFWQTSWMTTVKTTFHLVTEQVLGSSTTIEPVFFTFITGWVEGPLRNVVITLVMTPGWRMMTIWWWWSLWRWRDWTIGVRRPDVGEQWSSMWSEKLLHLLSDWWNECCE